MSKSVLVWDLPVRLFHWLLTGLLLAAFLIAELASEHSMAFAIHIVFGLMIGFILILRILWGLVGSRHARFSSFLFSPKALAEYIAGAIRGTSPRYAGHNPGSAYATYAMFILLPGIIASGLLLQSGSESFEEVHEALVYLMLAVVAVHLLGILLHTLRHKEPIARSIIDGKKIADSSSAIPSSRPAAAIVFAVLTVLFAGGLYRGLDPARKQLRIPLLGAVLQLGREAGDNDDDRDSDKDEGHGEHR